MTPRSKKQCVTRQRRTAIKVDLRQTSNIASQPGNFLSPDRDFAVPKLLREAFADLSAVATHHDISDPVPHHQAEFGSLIVDAIRGNRLASVFEAIAVKAVMDRSSVKLVNARNRGQFIHYAAR